MRKNKMKKDSSLTRKENRNVIITICAIGLVASLAIIVLIMCNQCCWDLNIQDKYQVKEETEE